MAVALIFECGGSMSTKGIYTALSGAIAQNQRLDTIANNIANVNTPAFKRDQQIFKEYLSANEKPQDVLQVPRIPASVESFYDTQGGEKSFVDSAGTYSDFSQGSLKATGQTLDMALEGEGFFEIATPMGVRLTRNGNFTMDGTGQLVTKQGYPVLSRAQDPGQPPEQRVIRLGQGVITVGDDGSIFQNNEPIAQVSVVNTTEKDALLKEGGNLYNLKSNFNTALTTVENPNLHQGYLEASNVNIVSEMTDMISASRTFEATQQVMKAYDSINDRLVNQVGKTS